MRIKLKPALRVWWRLLAFAFIGLFTGVIGYTQKTAANPGSETKAFAANAPLALDFLVSNPRISLKVQVYTNSTKLKSSEDVYVQADIPKNESGNILTLSNMPTRDPGFHRLKMAADNLMFSSVNAPYNNYYAKVTPVSNKTPAEIENNFSIDVDIFSSRSVLESTGASSYGHLPSINALYNADPYGEVAQCILGKLSPSGSLSDVYIDPSAEMCIGGSLAEGQYFPTNVLITEVLSGVASMLKTEQTDYINPSGNIAGSGYIWQSNLSLEPTFEVTNQDVVKKQSDDEFLAGVFLGLAGAALIAMVQELPESKRKRKTKNRPGQLKNMPPQSMPETADVAMSYSVIKKEPASLDRKLPTGQRNSSRILRVILLAFIVEVLSDLVSRKFIKR